MTEQRISHAVDELHVAAVLESIGVTDPVAQDSYGHHDVFELAAGLHRLLSTVALPAVAPPAVALPGPSGRALRPWPLRP